MITIGIDPHKASLTAVALDATGQQVAARRVVVNAAAYKTLMSWSAALGDASMLGKPIDPGSRAPNSTSLHHDRDVRICRESRVTCDGGRRSSL